MATALEAVQEMIDEGILAGSDAEDFFEFGVPDGDDWD